MHAGCAQAFAELLAADQALALDRDWDPEPIDDRQRLAALQTVLSSEGWRELAAQQVTVQAAGQTLIE